MSAAPQAGSDRPIRVLVAKPGLDGHDVGAKIVCRALRDAGMEVIYTGLRQSAESIARAAMQEDVDLVGLSILSGAHLPLCSKVAEALRSAAGSGEPIGFFVGGNIPGRDHDALRQLGARAVFPTGADLDAVVTFIQEDARR